MLTFTLQLAFSRKSCVRCKSMIKDLLNKYIQVQFVFHAVCYILPHHKWRVPAGFTRNVWSVMTTPVNVWSVMTTPVIESEEKSGEKKGWINPLNPELNPICYLLALLGAHHFLHVSRIRVKSLTLRLLMSYIYIYGAPILDVSRSHTTTQHSR